MRTVFFLGNKRSGTTFAVTVLNAHRKIFIAPEADIVWALYCRERGLPLKPHPDDGPAGLARTLATYAAQLDDADAGPRVFERVLHAMAVSSGKDWDELALVGDKKPVQQTDPDIFEFTLRQWPDARFIHIPRHPRAAIGSMQDRAASNLHFMEPWKRSTEALLDFWVRNERRVMQYKEAGRAPILTIPFHALVAEPAAKWGEVLDFLDLEPDAQMDAEIAKTARAPDRRYVDRPIPMSEAANEIVRQLDLQLAVD